MWSGCVFVYTTKERDMILVNAGAGFSKRAAKSVTKCGFAVVSFVGSEGLGEVVERGKILKSGYMGPLLRVYAPVLITVRKGCAMV